MREAEDVLMLALSPSLSPPSVRVLLLSLNVLTKEPRFSLFLDYACVSSVSSVPSEGHSAEEWKNPECERWRSEATTL